MALIKNIILPNGIQAEYWKVDQVSLSWYERRMLVTILGFLNKVSREAGEKPQAMKQVYYQGETFDFLPDDNLVADIYSKLKITVEFADAVDDI